MSGAEKTETSIGWYTEQKMILSLNQQKPYLCEKLTQPRIIMAAAAGFVSSNPFAQAELECAAQNREMRVVSYLQGREGTFEVKTDAWDNGYYKGTILCRLIELVPAGWFYTGFVKEISLRCFEGQREGQGQRVFLSWAPDYCCPREVRLFKEVQAEYGFPCDGISFMQTAPLALKGLEFLNRYNQFPPGQYERFRAILSGEAALKPLPFSPFDRGVVDHNYCFYQEDLEKWELAKKAVGTGIPG